MGSLHKRVRDKNDIKVLEEMFGKKPKHRCSVCHRFTLFNFNDPKLKEHNGCVMCHLIDQTRKERANEKRRNTKSTNPGE